jgi:cell volume regulation protein A
MLAGSEGIGGIWFDDYALSFRLGVVALVLILFEGGLNTPLDSLRRFIAPAGILATLGVAATTVLVALPARAIGLGWGEALLLGAVVSSTDAAAVFSVLRNSGMKLKRRVGATLEIESGLNDPMAVILTFALAGALAGGAGPSWRMALDVVVQFVVGAGAGIAIGLAGRWLLRRVTPVATGLYPVISLALAFLAFGLPTLFFGSGFLAVYLAAAVIGDGRLPQRAALLRSHDFVAWFSQVVMFLTLGLLVFPSRLPEIGWSNLAIVLLGVLAARLLVVALLLTPFRYPWREQLFIGWVGLRGAVPIVLATYPVLVGVPGAERIFHVVFFVVVLSVVLQGGTVSALARRLGLQARITPVPPAVLEVLSHRDLDADIVSFHLDPEAAVTGIPAGEVPMPEGAAIVLVARGRALLAPAAGLELQPGDHVYVVCRDEHRPELRLLFGQIGEE